MKHIGYLAASVGKILFAALLVVVLRSGSTSTAEATPKPAQCKAMHGFPTSTLIAPRAI